MQNRPGPDEADPGQDAKRQAHHVEPHDRYLCRRCGPTTSWPRSLRPLPQPRPGSSYASRRGGHARHDPDRPAIPPKNAPVGTERQPRTASGSWIRPKNAAGPKKHSPALPRRERRRPGYATAGPARATVHSAMAYRATRQVAATHMVLLRQGGGRRRVGRAMPVGIIDRFRRSQVRCGTAMAIQAEPHRQRACLLGHGMSWMVPWQQLSHPTPLAMWIL
jgi:hypothetical protein